MDCSNTLTHSFINSLFLRHLPAFQRNLWTLRNPRYHTANSHMGMLTSWFIHLDATDGLVRLAGQEVGVDQSVDGQRVGR